MSQLWIELLKSLDHSMHLPLLSVILACGVGLRLVNLLTLLIWASLSRLGLTVARILILSVGLKGREVCILWPAAKLR